MATYNNKWYKSQMVFNHTTKYQANIMDEIDLGGICPK